MDRNPFRVVARVRGVDEVIDRADDARTADYLAMEYQLMGYERVFVEKPVVVEYREAA